MTAPAPPRVPLWRFALRLAPLAVLWAVLVGLLGWLLATRADWNEASDEADMREWVENTRVFRKTLAGLVDEYVSLLAADGVHAHADRLADRRAEIRQHLEAMVEPTRMYAGQLPLFPVVYSFEIEFAGVRGPDGRPPEPIVWQSPKPRPGPSARAQLRTLTSTPQLDQPGARATVRCVYHLHTLNRMQQRQDEYRYWQTAALAVLVPGTLLALFLAVRAIRREQARELERWQAAAAAEHRERELLEAQVQRELVERSLLEARVKQQELVRAGEELNRKLLEGELDAAKLKTRAAEAESAALEMKSQLYASIGIMAGSYAHNIKNLLVRPNDLIARCMEAAGDAEQHGMLEEVRSTLGTVTERLQQILRTVRRDPSNAEVTQVDVFALFRDTQRTWADMGRDKWKLAVTADVPPGAAPVTGDLSHLQQAVENLVFNARDATFEMRNYLRNEAKRETDPAARRHRLLDAAGWKGEIGLRAWADAGSVVLEVRDNGIGMTDEVRRNCLRTHFSTKRDNALYEGYSAGMGLGLSFVAMVLEHHGGALEIESAPLRGTTFRVRFPLAGERPA